MTKPRLEKPKNPCPTFYRFCDNYSPFSKRTVSSLFLLKRENANKKSEKSKTKDQISKSGRPKGSKNKNKEEIVLSPELARILLWTQKFLALIGKKIPLHYLVLDGYFGNHPSYQMRCQVVSFTDGGSD